MEFKKQHLAVAIAVVAFLTVAGVSAAPKASGGKTTTTYTRTTVYDYSDGTGGGTTAGAVPLYLHSDDYTGVGTPNCLFGTYADYQTINNGTNNVLSDLNLNNGFNLHLASQTLRKLYIDPTEAINAQQPTNPPPSSVGLPSKGCYSNGVDLYGNCFNADGSIIGLPNLVNKITTPWSPGYSTNCSLAVNFTPASTEYKLMMAPPLNLPPSTCSASGCPSTGLVTITCNKLDSTNSTCVDWTIANASAPNPDVANLYYYSNVRGTQTLNFVGQYYNSFLIHVVAQ